MILVVKTELTGLEPATSAVTGQRSNQLSYNSSESSDSSAEPIPIQTDFRPGSGWCVLHGSRGRNPSRILTERSDCSVPAAP
jgi:hypothetical protein